MTKNEIVARWLGWVTERHLIKLSEGHEPYIKTIEYPMNYETLHEAWVKFRDLKFERYDRGDEFHRVRRNIENSICYDTITEAFDELVKGITWYETLNK